MIPWFRLFGFACGIVQCACALLALFMVVPRQGAAELMFHFLHVEQVSSKPALSDSNSTEHSPYLIIYGHFSPDSLQLP